MLRKPSAIYAKYSTQKKALSTKISKENLLEQKSKAEPTALTDYKKSLLFGEVCPASKKKKKNIQSFAHQFSFLRISFFLFFSIFFSTGATDFTEKKKLLVFHYTKYHT